MNITKGKIPTALKVVVYGPEGIGKSTFASQFPGAVFIDTEGSTTHMDVARFDKPGKWMDIHEAVDWTIAHPDQVGTLVIDTADWAEKLATRYVCKEEVIDPKGNTRGWDNIEVPGYGKGYVALKNAFQVLLDKLSQLPPLGVNVVITAHAILKKFEQPDEMGAYDRWALKLNEKNVAPIVKEWADILLFMNYDVVIVEENGRNKAKGKAKRKMHANHRPTYDAKNRYGLPDDMELSFEPLKDIYAGTVPVRKETTYWAVDTPTDGIVEDNDGEDVRDALAREIVKNGRTVLEVEAWLVATGRLAPGGHLEDLSGTAAESMLNNIETLLAQIGGKK